jgi:hypothetical protein
VIMDFTKIPPSVLDAQSMMRASLSISDPLLLVTALEAGADVNDVCASVPALKNARARKKSYMIQILEQAGAKLH